jgi:hypothetical protein
VRRSPIRAATRHDLEQPTTVTAAVNTVGTPQSFQPLTSFHKSIEGSGPDQSVSQCVRWVAGVVFSYSVVRPYLTPHGPEELVVVGNLLVSHIAGNT